jgi:hypothetical protein
MDPLDLLDPGELREPRVLPVHQVYKEPRVLPVHQVYKEKMDQ